MRDSRVSPESERKKEKKSRWELNTSVGINLDLCGEEGERGRNLGPPASAELDSPEHVSVEKLLKNLLPRVFKKNSQPFSHLLVARSDSSRLHIVSP